MQTQWAESAEQWVGSSHHFHTLTIIDESAALPQGRKRELRVWRLQMQCLFSLRYLDPHEQPTMIAECKSSRGVLGRILV